MSQPPPSNSELFQTCHRQDSEPPGRTCLEAIGTRRSNRVLHHGPGSTAGAGPVCSGYKACTSLTARILPTRPWYSPTRLRLSFHPSFFRRRTPPPLWAGHWRTPDRQADSLQGPGGSSPLLRTTLRRPTRGREVALILPLLFFGRDVGQKGYLRVHDPCVDRLPAYTVNRDVSNYLYVPACTSSQATSRASSWASSRVSSRAHVQQTTISRSDTSEANSRVRRRIERRGTSVSLPNHPSARYPSARSQLAICSPSRPREEGTRQGANIFVGGR
jgi:hypothetical protein